MVNGMHENMKLDKMKLDEEYTAFVSIEFADKMKFLRE